MQIATLLEEFRTHLPNKKPNGDLTGQQKTSRHTLEGVIAETLGKEAPLTDTDKQHTLAASELTALHKKYAEKLATLIENSKTKRGYWVEEVAKESLKAFERACSLQASAITITTVNLAATATASSSPSTAVATPGPQHPHGDPKLVKIFKETQRWSTKGVVGNEGGERHKLNQEMTKQMIAQTIGYETNKAGQLVVRATGELVDAPPRRNYKTTNYQLSNQDTLAATKELIAQGLNPAVHNMANPFFIGGGAEDGTGAQEETLLQCSDYSEALYPKGTEVTTGPYRGRFTYGEANRLFGNTSFYTPNVQVFRDPANNYKVTEPFSASFIAVAGIDLGKPHQYHKDKKLHEAAKQGKKALLDFFKARTQEKIEHILDVALLKGHDSMVFGALSCGAFKLPDADDRLPDGRKGLTAKTVAEAYSTVLNKEKYKNQFRTITFAIKTKDPANDLNYTTFKEKLHSFFTQSVPKPAATAASAAAAAMAGRPGADTKANKDQRPSGDASFLPSSRPTAETSPTETKKFKTEADHLFATIEANGFFNQFSKRVEGNVRKAACNTLRDYVDTGEYQASLFEDDVGGDRATASRIETLFSGALRKAEDQLEEKHKVVNDAFDKLSAADKLFYQKFEKSRFFRDLPTEVMGLVEYAAKKSLTTLPESIKSDEQAAELEKIFIDELGELGEEVYLNFLDAFVPESERRPHPSRK